MESNALLRREDRLSYYESFLPCGLDLSESSGRADQGAFHAVNRASAALEIKARSAEAARAQSQNFLRAFRDAQAAGGAFG